MQFVVCRMQCGGVVVGKGVGGVYHLVRSSCSSTRSNSSRSNSSSSSQYTEAAKYQKVIRKPLPRSYTISSHSVEDICLGNVFLILFGAFLGFRGVVVGVVLVVVYGGIRSSSGYG